MRCPTCGSPLSSGNMFCGKCGIPVIEALIKEFREKTLIILGDVVLDETISVLPSSPGAHHQISKSSSSTFWTYELESRSYFAGGAGTVARCARIFTDKVSLFGSWGKDGEGRKLEKELKNQGITFHNSPSGSPTIVKHRIYGTKNGYPKQLLFRYDTENEVMRSDLADAVGDSIVSRVLKYGKLPNSAIFIYDVDKGNITDHVVERLGELIRNKTVKTPLIVKPKKRWRLYKELPISALVAGWDDAIEGAALEDPAWLERGFLLVAHESKWKDFARDLIRDLAEAFPLCASFAVQVERTGETLVGIRDKTIGSIVHYDVLSAKGNDKRVSSGYLELFGAILSLSFSSKHQSGIMWSCFYLAGSISSLHLDSDPAYLITLDDIRGRMSKGSGFEWPKSIGVDSQDLSLKKDSKTKEVLDALRNGCCLADARTELPKFYSVTLGEKVSVLVNNIRKEQQRSRKGPVLIHISGESRAGKSFFAKSVMSLFGAGKSMKTIDCTNPKKQDPLQLLKTNSCIYLDEFDKSLPDFQAQWLKPLEDQRFGDKMVLFSTIVSFSLPKNPVLQDFARRAKQELSIEIPIVSDRPMDIPYIFAALMFAFKRNARSFKMSMKALEMLLRYDFPRGNSDLVDVAQDLCKHKQITSSEILASNNKKFQKKTVFYAKDDELVEFTRN